MIYDISKFEELVEQGYLRKSEDKDLVLYGYTDKCTYDRHWNEYTRAARGLILEKATGKVVAKPFPKFFNLGEMEETFMKNLPNCGYTATQKVDGSLGIIFNYEGVWRVATRGSLYSDQAVRAAEILKQYDLRDVSQDTTLLVEIIYPENKIIIDYEETEALVLLSAFDRVSEKEFTIPHVEDISDRTGLDRPWDYTHTVEEMIALKKTLPIQDEGFVVRFDSGLRVKIKGDEYMRVSKIMAHMSPISLWEVMKDGKVDTHYLMQLPEELRVQFQDTVFSLELAYKKVLKEVEHEYSTLPTHEASSEGRKTIGLYLKERNPKHSGAMFSKLLGKEDSVDKYILRCIRPNANVLIE